MAIICVNSKILIEDKIEFKEGNLNTISCSLTDKNLSLEEIEVKNINFKVNLDVVDFYYPCNIAFDATNEEVEEYKRLSRSAAKNYFTRQNANILNKINIEGFSSKYVSSYAPIVEFDFTPQNYLQYGKEILTILSSNNEVESIMVSGTEVPQNLPQLSLSMETVGANYDFTNRTYTGEGIRVGILEAGVVDQTHPNFANTSLTVRDEWYYVETVAEHTTEMASIIGGQGGIAPDAMLYSVEAYGNLTSEIDWLLDNNVDIVNMSFAQLTNLGVYSEMSAYIDYIAYHYNLLFVGCASNNINGTSKVANPGLGYNVLTVGSTTRTDIICSFSSYLNDSELFKPDVYVPGSDVAIPGFTSLGSGTSISTAIMTGLVALQMERYPSLKVKPAMVKALACASSDYIGASYMASNGYDEIAGAGRVNYLHFGDNYGFFSEHLTASSSSSTIIHDDTQQFFADETFTMCASSLAYSDGTVDSIKFTPYQIKLYNSAGTLLAVRTVSTYNTIFIRYDIQADGLYTFKLIRTGTAADMVTPSGEYVALDLRIDYDPDY